MWNIDKTLFERVCGSLDEGWLIEGMSYSERAYDAFICTNKEVYTKDFTAEDFLVVDKGNGLALDGESAFKNPFNLNLHFNFHLSEEKFETLCLFTFKSPNSMKLSEKSDLLILNDKFDEKAMSDVFISDPIDYNSDKPSITVNQILKKFDLGYNYVPVNGYGAAVLAKNPDEAFEYAKIVEFASKVYLCEI